MEVHARKSLHCCKWTINVNSGELSKRKEERCRESLNLHREHVSNSEWNVGRNMDGKDHSDETLDGNEKRVIRHWRKRYPCYKLTKLAELFVS